MWPRRVFRNVEVMIVAENLTKRYGEKTAVADVSFTVQPGKVTGFLGPNGAGKSTTMRMIVGLARRRAGKFSLGMGQRLGIAAALLGDPHTLILDEPVNGLDPEGVRWVRQFVRAQAAQGRTVLLSSHLMSEMSLTADHVIVLGRGRVLADAPIDELVRGWTRTTVTVRTPRADELTRLVAGPDVTIEAAEAGALLITGVDAAVIGDTAAANGIPLHELSPRAGSLEDAYLALTETAVEYKTKDAR